MSTLPVWTPKHPETSQMWQFMQFIASRYEHPMTDYQALHTWSIQNPALFWQSLCDFFNLAFDTPASTVLSHANDMLQARWFEGAQLNVVKRWLSRNDAHPALIGLNEQGERQTFSYQSLQQHVMQCAAGLQEAGVAKGDRVAAIMPNIPQTIIAMLATASIGAIWSSCSPDFGAQTILDRLEQIEPKLLFACDGHQYHGKTHSAFEKIHQIATSIPSISHIVLYPVLHEETLLTTLPNSTAWKDFLKPSTAKPYTAFPFSHPLYILFSSGTTGKPKCIVHGAGGTLLQHLKELGLHTDVQPHDNLFFYTTCGWMMWNWMVSALALGATLILYEGSPTYPDAGRLFQIIELENVTVFGTSAKFISTVEKALISPKESYDLTQLRCILSTGSPLMPQNYDFVYNHIQPNVQLSSISGGTDIIACFALGNPLLPVYRGELQCLGLGMSVAVFDEQGHAVEEARGELVCTKPFPSMPIGFWHDPEKVKYQDAYFSRFPGVWAHGDFAEITAHHGLIIYGRSDAVLNPGGVRIGTAEIYRQVETIPDVLDSIVIGQDWKNDVRIVLFVKLREGLELTEALENTIRKTIRHQASPRHVPAKILQVTDIPRTISGKIVELAVRNVVHNRPVHNLESLANPEALKEFSKRPELEY